MKFYMNYLIFITIIFAVNTAIFSQEIDQTVLIAQEEQQQFHPQLKTRSSGSSLDVIYQRLEINIDPAIRYISGRVKTTFQSTGSDIDQIRLDVSNELTIERVTTVLGTDLSFEQKEDHTLIVHFDQPVVDTASIRINYSGVPPENGLGSFRQSEHGTGSIIWTLSEPYGALDWWPCNQNLNDKIDSLDLLIEVPKGFQAASNGVLINRSEKPQSGTEVFHWQHRYPIATYLVAFAVSNYILHEDVITLKKGDLHIMNYLYPQNFDNNVRILERDLPSMMRLFDSLFISYPFIEEKYGHAQFGFGGGMEHQTISFMYNFSYGLMAHELAHHWFGDYITCNSWQDIWLNEGFATYLTGLTYEHIVKNGTWENFLDSKIKSITSQNGGSVRVDDTTSVGRIFNSRLTYNKGAMLLHMLRWILGDSAFYKGIQNYLNDPELRYSYSKTEDLKQHLENASGKDLTEFFTDWYEGQGFPSYHIEWNQQQDHTINFKISQSTSHPSVDFFEMPVPIRVFGPSTDTLLILEHTRNDQTFEAEVSFPADSIMFDPDQWIISKNNNIGILSSTKNDWTGKITIYPNPASDEVHISTEDVAIHGYEVLNSLGKILVRQEIIPSTSFGIPIYRFPHGLYFLKLHIENKEVIIKKIVKSR